MPTVTVDGDDELPDVAWDADERPVGADFSSWNHPEAEGGDDQTTTLLFTATNPPETVSASALMDGRIVRVDLSPQETQMTERQLAEEITVISALARRQAQAAQHVLAARVMRDLGHDGPLADGYLEHELRLPSPQTVRTEKLHVFTTRYADERD
jgi:hypothetical protein